MKWSNTSMLRMNIWFIIIIILVIINFIFNIKGLAIDGFAATSPGTMVQLRTSHVPTQADEHYWRHVYPKIVKKEIYNLTESDLH